MALIYCRSGNIEIVYSKHIQFTRDIFIYSMFSNLQNHDLFTMYSS